MMRFLRALIQALRLTLRGETLTPSHFRPLEDWITTGLDLADQVDAAAASQRIDLSALQLKLDGRPTSLERSLQMVRHNLVNEYPRLIRLDDPYSMTVVSSINMNDQYRVGQFLLADELTSETLRSSLAALNAHLLNLPQIERNEKENED